MLSGTIEKYFITVVPVSVLTPGTGSGTDGDPAERGSEPNHFTDLRIISEKYAFRQKKRQKEKEAC